MSVVVAVQYIKVDDLPLEVRLHEKLKSGFVKKTIKFGSFTTERVHVDDPAKDILKCLSKMECDFSSVVIGDLSDIKK